MPAKSSPAKKPQGVTSKKWFKVGLPLALVAVFAAVGAYYVGRSRAASMTDTKPAYISSIAGHGCVTSGKYPPTLSQGSRGECVKALQLGLNNRKAFVAWVTKTPYSPIATDGVFGSQTRASVIDFQRAKGINADGVVGSATWSNFLNDCTVKNSCVSVSGVSSVK